MKKWTASILAGIAGILGGLSLSGNLMISKLFLDGIEVDLSDPTAVEWALANPSKSEWQTYLVLGQESVFVLPGSYWAIIVPLACALLFFSTSSCAVICVSSASGPALPLRSIVCPFTDIC